MEVSACLTTPSALRAATPPQEEGTPARTLHPYLPPDSWNRARARGTPAVFHVHLQNTESGALDQERIASRTRGVFPRADRSWEVAGIHKIEALLFSNFRCLQERGCGRITVSGH